MTWFLRVVDIDTSQKPEAFRFAFPTTTEKMVFEGVVTRRDEAGCHPELLIRDKGHPEVKPDPFSEGETFPGAIWRAVICVLRRELPWEAGRLLGSFSDSRGRWYVFLPREARQRASVDNKQSAKERPPPRKAAEKRANASAS